MSKADIIDYLNKGLKRGYGLNTLKHTLLQHGHDPAIVEECASAVTSRPQPAHHGSPSFLKKKSPLPWVAFGIVIILIAGVAIYILLLEQPQTIGQVVYVQEEPVTPQLLSQKQQEIDAKISEIERLNLTIEEKEVLIQEQLRLIKEINEENKNQMQRIRDFMLEIANRMLGRIS